MARLSAQLPAIDNGLELEEFSIYEGDTPHKWNKVLPHDRSRRSAQRAQPPPRRHRPQDPDRAAGRRFALGGRDRRPGRPVIDAVLEADPAAGSRRGDPAPGRFGRPEQDRARDLGFRLGRERRPLRSLAAEIRRCRQRDAGGDGVLPDGGRCRLHAARRGRGHAELRRVLQEADRRGAAQERHLAFCDGEDQVGHRLAGAGGVGLVGSTTGDVVRAEHQQLQSSYAGLTRVSINLHESLAKKMDCRVKPGNDELGQIFWLYAPTSGWVRSTESIASNRSRIRCSETGLSTTTTSSGLLEEARTRPQLPSSTVTRTPLTVTRSRIFCPATFSFFFCIASKCFTTLSTTPYLVSSAQCGDMVGDDQVFGSAFFKSAIDLPGARSSISQTAIAEIRPSS